MLLQTSAAHVIDRDCEGLLMGYITYDGTDIEMDDRTLTHLHIVIVQKLRQTECFTMSWAYSADVGSGRASIWLHPSIPIHFRFDGSRVPSVNPVWLAELTKSANSSRGLIVTAENPPAAVAALVPAPRTARERRLESA